MKYLLPTNTCYEHLGKKFQRTVLTCVGRDGSEMAVCLLEMATAQSTRPRAVVGALRRAAWQLKSALRHSISAAYNNFFTFFFLIIAGDFLLMNNNG